MPGSMISSRTLLDRAPEGVPQLPPLALGVEGDGGLETVARWQFESRCSAYSSEPKQSGERQKILVSYLNPDGTIRQIPNSRTQAGKFQVILEHVTAAFEPGVIYTEKEVNAIIHRFNQDVSGLRRDLVEAGLIARERDGSKYWRPQ